MTNRPVNINTNILSTFFFFDIYYTRCHSLNYCIIRGAIVSTTWLTVIPWTVLSSIRLINNLPRCIRIFLSAQMQWFRVFCLHKQSKSRHYIIHRLRHTLSPLPVENVGWPLLFSFEYNDWVEKSLRLWIPRKPSKGLFDAMATGIA